MSELMLGRKMAEAQDRRKTDGVTREKCFPPTVITDQHCAGWNEPGTEQQTRHTLTCTWNLKWWLTEAEVRK